MIVLTTFITGVGLGICGKPDAAAVQFLAFIVGLTGIALLLRDKPLHFEQLGLPESRWYPKMVRGFSCFKVIHVAFSIHFATGAITLALQFRYKNP